MYSFTVIPFGYKNSSTALTTALQGVLGDLLKRVIVYVDDIFVPGREAKDHLELLERVLDHFEHSGATVNLKKNVNSYRLL